MYLIMTGSSLAEWLEIPKRVTGLYPFMSMAKSNGWYLEDVYDVAMMNLNNILQRKFPARDAKCSGSSQWTRDQNSKRLKRV